MYFYFPKSIYKKLDNTSLKELSVDGALVVHKPCGVSSKDVGRFVERKLGGSVKVGHAGTLDPLAEGVLPILLGRATRLQDYLIDSQKTYYFEVEFGYATSTQDKEGDIVAICPLPILSNNNIEEILSLFRGTIRQVPPLYSAVKFKGKPLYRYARSSSQVTESESFLANLSREITISRLDCVSLRSEKGCFVVACSKGTYVRQLGSDIAEKLGTLGTTVRIIRQITCGFSLNDAIPLIDLCQDNWNLAAAVISMNKLKTSLLTIRLNNLYLLEKLSQGQEVAVIERDFSVVECGFRSRDLSIDQEPALIMGNEGDLFGIGVMKRVVQGDSSYDLSKSKKDTFTIKLTRSLR